MILSSMRLSYEREPSIISNLTFDYARDYFSRKSLEFGQSHFSQLGFTDEQGRFTNLALLFSDQNPHVLKIAEFGSKDNLSFMDRKEISGSVLKQLEMAYDTLLYNRRISKFNGLERVDHLLYSTDSIREALVNSLIHCDYSQYIFRFEVEFLLVLLFDCFRATEVLLFNSFQGKRFLEHDL